jgi:hypothetical protein
MAIWAVQSSKQKYSSFRKSEIVLFDDVLHRLKGRFAIVTNVGAGCDGRRQHRQTCDVNADGQVVWS